MPWSYSSLPKSLFSGPFFTGFWQQHCNTDKFVVPSVTTLPAGSISSSARVTGGQPCICLVYHPAKLIGISPTNWFCPDTYLDIFCKWLQTILIQLEPLVSLKGLSRFFTVLMDVLSEEPDHSSYGGPNLKCVSLVSWAELIVQRNNRLKKCY